MQKFVAVSLMASVVAAGPVSPVKKVIELINELKGKVQSDLKAESAAMEEYSAFCDDEQKDKGYAIETAASDIERYSATIEEAAGTITSMESTLATKSSTAAAKESELKDATGVREAENADFVAADKELVDTVDTLARAITIIKREMSFVQAGHKSNVGAKLRAMSAALEQVIGAAYLDTAARSKLKSFMSTDMDDELTLHVRQPQAATYAYESKSGSIVTTLEDLKDKAESELSSLRKQEMESKHAYEMLKQSLNDALTVLAKEVANAKSNKGAAEEEKASAEGDLSSTEASKKADEEYLSKLTNECTAKAGEWEERQKSAADEVAALEKGSEILTAKFGFIQLSVAKGTKSHDAARDKAVSVLKKLGRKFNSFAMMQIANAASADPFGKVRGLIESMIAKLQEQAAAEATHDSYCKEATAENTKSKEKKQAETEKLQARIDEATAGISELKNEIATLGEELAEAASAMAAATKMRAEENANFKTASKDFKESAEAITQALVVLKDFYKGGASFIQQGPEFGSAKSDSSHAILEILEVAQSDFTKLLAESETDEAEAAEAFETLKQDSAIAVAKKTAAKKGKEAEVKATEVALSNAKEDFGTASAELDSVLEFLAKLKKECTSKAMTYEERKARRDAELAGLQEALAILSGDDVAAFIQKRGFLHKKL